ncbi:hypothetical protein NGB24_07070 [Mammaliicoccus vitulinus]|uniref:hypothetical protein n=1 Tax=Mammaliicoccus vitulinus TaxID=71237 RepID=UPI002DBCFF63|nr:hypothetical protein [Mammaliicoccus vitulinus]MEB7657613.1 hypothetical protein [Mammaliicoccus vitulinus]
MFNAKCILIGDTSYNENDNYKPLLYENYPTGIVVFFPEIKNKSYDLYELTTYRRLLGFLNSRPLTKEEFTNLDSPHQLVEYYTNNDIYFINQSEIKIKNSIIQDLNKNNLFLIDDITIICFGDEAIEKFKNVKNIIKCPHPSRKVSHKFWEKYDYRYRKDYNFNFDFQNFFYTLK